MPLPENIKLQISNLLKTVDLYHIHNIAWNIFIENKLKMQSVWDARRKILAKLNKDPYYNKKHKN